MCRWLTGLWTCRRLNRTLWDNLYKIVSSERQLPTKFLPYASRKKARLNLRKVTLHGVDIVHTAIHKAFEALQHYLHR